MIQAGNVAGAPGPCKKPPPFGTRFARRDGHGRGRIEQPVLDRIGKRLLSGHPAEMAERFAGLLWGNLMVGLLLRIADRPNPREITRRAGDAAAAFLRLYPQPDEAETARPPSAGNSR